MFGRNEPCPCGSGKKYKKCCLNKDQELSTSLSEIAQNKTPAEMAAELKKQTFFNPAVPSHDCAMGIREMALAQIQQIIIYLSRDHVRDDLIQFNARDVLQLLNHGEIHYLKVMREINEMKGLSRRDLEKEMSILKQKVKIKPKLNRNERILIRQTMHGLLMEYALVGDLETCDYGAMRVSAEFCYHAVKQGIPENENYSSATLYVDTGNTLVNWEFHQDNLPHTQLPNENNAEIFIRWKPLDELEHEYESYAHALTGLSEESKKMLASALVQEKSMNKKSADKISYSGIIMNYFGIIERELRELIAQLEGWESTKRMMWHEISEYVRKNAVPYITENIPDFYEKMKQLNGIRNKAAHGEFISSEDFNRVKSLAVNKQLLQFISWAKVDAEEQTV
jgi:hypothetical protein